MEKSDQADLGLSICPSLTSFLELPCLMPAVYPVHLLHVWTSAVALISIQEIRYLLSHDRDTGALQEVGIVFERW